MMVSLPLVSLIDILIRTLALGQLLLLAVLLMREPATTIRHLLLAGGISVAGLMMLTAPVPDEHYGLLRNVLLLITDAFPFIFWLLNCYLFDDHFSPEQWPRSTKVLLGLFALVYIYALGVQAGIGPLHDLIHAAGLLLILHVGYIAFRGFSDDLVDTRRRARIMVVLGISLYSTVLVVFEFADERFRNASIFGLINATILLLAITIIMGRLFRLRYQPAGRTLSGPAPAPVDHATETPTEPSDTLQLLAQSLDSFIARRGYHQNALTITSLAQQLDCPEHHLRRLINQTRGYRNFNSLLNDLRIADAQKRLADPAYDSTPILSIALSLGYDSIGPFNRAFKAATAQTPGEFRRSVQNRR